MSEYNVEKKISTFDYIWSSGLLLAIIVGIIALGNRFFGYWGFFIAYNITVGFLTLVVFEVMADYSHGVAIKRFNKDVDYWFSDLLEIMLEYRGLDNPDDIIKERKLREAFINRVYMATSRIHSVEIVEKIRQIKTAKTEFVYPMMENITGRLVYNREDIDIKQLLDKIAITNYALELTKINQMKWTLCPTDKHFRYIANDITDDGKVYRVVQDKDEITLSCPGTAVKYEGPLKPYGKKLIDAIVNKDN